MPPTPSGAGADRHGKAREPHFAAAFRWRVFWLRPRLPLRVGRLAWVRAGAGFWARLRQDSTPRERVYTDPIQAILARRRRAMDKRISKRVDEDPFSTDLDLLRLTEGSVSGLDVGYHSADRAVWNLTILCCSSSQSVNQTQVRLCLRVKRVAC